MDKQLLDKVRAFIDKMAAVVNYEGWQGEYFLQAKALSEALAAPVTDTLCIDCAPIGYPTDETRCELCPRRSVLSGDESDYRWWCAYCKTAVRSCDVTFKETHDPRNGGCGYSVAPQAAPSVEAGQGVERFKWCTDERNICKPDEYCACRLERSRRSGLPPKPAEYQLRKDGKWKLSVPTEGMANFLAEKYGLEIIPLHESTSAPAAPAVAQEPVFYTHVIDGKFKQHAVWKRRDSAEGSRISAGAGEVVALYASPLAVESPSTYPHIVNVGGLAYCGLAEKPQIDLPNAKDFQDIHSIACSRQWANGWNDCREVVMRSLQVQAQPEEWTPSIERQAELYRHMQDAAKDNGFDSITAAIAAAVAARDK